MPKRNRVYAVLGSDDDAQHGNVSDVQAIHEFHSRLSSPSPSETSQGGDKASSSSASDSLELPNADSANMTLGERVAQEMHAPSRRRSMIHISTEAESATYLRKGSSKQVKTDKCASTDEIQRRLNKHAPVEERISRKPVTVLRDAVQKKSYKRMDPRFSMQTRSSDHRECDLARRRYAFLYEDTMPTEVRELKSMIKKSSDPTEKRRAQIKLSRLQQSMHSHENRTLELEVENEWKAREKAKLGTGKKPFFLKESEKKKLVLEKKFSRLEESGQLEKFMAKKRKRVASKMHTKLPYRRSKS